MNYILDMTRILLPIIIVGGIAVFVILRMKYKYENGTLGKKKTKSSQNLLDSLIPLGMMIGTVLAIFLNMFTTVSLLSAITWGPGLGLLAGYLAYEQYSKSDTYSY